MGLRGAPTLDAAKNRVLVQVRLEIEKLEREIKEMRESTEVLKIAGDFFDMVER